MRDTKTEYRIEQVQDWIERDDFGDAGKNQGKE